MIPDLSPVFTFIVKVLSYAIIMASFIVGIKIALNIQNKQRIKPLEKKFIFEKMEGYKNMDLDKFEEHPAKDLILRLMKEDPILDIGGGNGNILKYYRDKRNLVIDPSVYGVKKCRERGINAVVTTLEDFKTGRKFKSILCIGVIDSINERVSFMKKIRSLLASNGKLYISFQTSNFGFSQFRNLLRLSGFELIKFYGMGRIKIPALSKVVLAECKNKIKKEVNGSTRNN